MRVYAFHLLILIFLSACSTQHVEINIHKNGEVESTISPSSKTQITTVTEIPNPEPKVMEKKVTVTPLGWCPKFVMPSLIPTPPIPKDIVTKREMLDEQLIGILTEYAYELRKNAIDNQTVLRRAYQRHLDSCKK